MPRIPDLDDTVDAIRIAEGAARLALVLCRPVSAGQGKIHLRPVPFREFWFWEPNFLTALITSLGEVA